MKKFIEIFIAIVFDDLKSELVLQLQLLGFKIQNQIIRKIFIKNQNEFKKF